MLLPRAEAKAAGHKYYLGRQCPHGHDGKRRVKDFDCDYCARDAERRRRQRKAKTPEAKAKKKARRSAMMKRTRARRPELRAAHNMRRRVHHFLKGTRLSGTAILGCSKVFFREHIESMWQAGMTWENYGLGADKWNIDHKRPVASFDLRDPDQIAAANHYTNLQPMWQVDNMRKGASY